LLRLADALHFKQGRTRRIERHHYPGLPSWVKNKNSPSQDQLSLALSRSESCVCLPVRSSYNMSLLSQEDERDSNIANREPVTQAGASPSGGGGSSAFLERTGEITGDAVEGKNILDNSDRIPVGIGRSQNLRSPQGR
jgi:hypothetical protein